MRANLKIEDLEFFVNSWKELYILNEVFYQGAYNIQIKEDFVFIDI